ncbi:prealbumin-like fold domain-containing protein [Actinacidiphila sp. DG2A-62]|uniref:MSCRAMM family protein n=1 Tax=Actinacidiphila sp. DG2A-62 TaxID=3108821 RepID=UPI002DBA0ADD|nr:prealbumin-like fold domain-containing protein [Actinacidiphila sp. DG2A-62]MEC3997185.1 prealbumin-like fold domain-containing protein [Actinacidiphila sp. DG2A-62]
MPSPATPHGGPTRDVLTSGISIHVTATDDTPVSGATFVLTDVAGTTTASGIADADGRLSFADLPAGLYHLRQTATGSAAIQPAADQDVVVPADSTLPTLVTVIDRFTPANLTVRVTDRTGKPLPGAVVAVTDSSGTTLTITTGHSGSAQTALPITNRTGTVYTATERSGPNGAPLHGQHITLRAEPGALVAITLTDPTTPSTPPTTAATSTTAPTPSATHPTSRASQLSATAQAPSASGAPTGRVPRAQLAQTGADATTWLAGIAGLLMIVGAGALSGASHRRAQSKRERDGRSARSSR